MALLPAEQVRTGQGRLPFQEAMSLTPLPDKVAADENGGGKVVKRYMSRRRVWVTGDELVSLAMAERASDYRSPGTGAYGGHVYSQSGLAASLAYRAAQDPGLRGKDFGIHTIHGFFSEGGRTDRPFVYEVSNLSANALFPSYLVTARQPARASTSAAGDHYPAAADAALPLGPVCFSALVSFRPAGITQVDAAEAPSAWRRFAAVLGSRRPAQWDPAPAVDIAGVLDAIPGARRAVGMFPGLDMRKVDMRAYNAGRPFHERRELVLYRLLAPLPATVATEEGEGEGECAIAGPDAHIAAHAYAADRNGLLMIGDHAGYGHAFGRAASLSYSFVVHVNAADAVMAYGDADADAGAEGGDVWWLQETSFPRVHAGRGIVYCKIWSPRGVHVATEYQDGIIRRKNESSGIGEKEKGKL
ncbi:putative acyl- thioesterase II [Rosellinia necatrix]|uniref:Putative acyl-thioesterase II n=1 Tax=Rosellinia necatrix TaxID=77044 RepID=A0A1S8AB58_ROSNE|nr:putative acyl- thioesterase II [Rosellinia necatrix]